MGSEAIIVADNVLKPGAPLFLWRVLTGGSYDTRVLRVREFAMPSEDWMSVSIYRGSTARQDRDRGEPGASSCSSSREETKALAPPAELVQLNAEADLMRKRAITPGGGVTFTEWAAFAASMRQRLAAHGIEAVDSV